MKLIICLVSRHLRIGIIRTSYAMEFEELSASIAQFVLLIFLIKFVYFKTHYTLGESFDPYGLSFVFD